MKPIIQVRGGQQYNIQQDVTTPGSGGVVTLLHKRNVTRPPVNDCKGLTTQYSVKCTHTRIRGGWVHFHKNKVLQSPHIYYIMSN